MVRYVLHHHNIIEGTRVSTGIKDRFKILPRDTYPKAVHSS